MDRNIASTEPFTKQCTRFCTCDDIYFDGGNSSEQDSNSMKDFRQELNPKVKKLNKEANSCFKVEGLWCSPSDVLEELVDLKSPYTTRIFKAQTHQGVLEIGGKILEDERARFHTYLENIIQINDSSWDYIKDLESENIQRKIEDTYNKIFMKKNEILQKDAVIFVEKTLQELENSVKEELKNTVIANETAIVRDMEIQIHEKLALEKCKLGKKLQIKNKNEIDKLKDYYGVLLRSEKHNKAKAVNKAIYERNDALRAFCRATEAEKLTSTMYVLSTERRKCKMERFILENYQTEEINKLRREVKEKDELLQCFSKITIPDLNREWQLKIKKVINLFLKFLSFSMKLIPEQTMFLLDLEKLVLMQLNEYRKSPVNTTSILIDKEEIDNVFLFEKSKEATQSCKRIPFEIEGHDKVDSSTNTTGSFMSTGHELLYTIIDKQFVYTKCQKIEEVRKLLSEKCLFCKNPKMCWCSYSKQTLDEPSFFTPISMKSISTKASKSDLCSWHENSSSNFSGNTYVIQVFNRHQECPAMNCKSLNTTVGLSAKDIDEYNKDSQFLLSGTSTPLPPECINVKNLVHPHPVLDKPSFRADQAIQYSLNDLPDGFGVIEKCTCPCSSFISLDKMDIESLLEKRKQSLLKLIQQRSSLLRILFDEL